MRPGVTCSGAPRWGVTSTCHGSSPAPREKRSSSVVPVDKALAPLFGPTPVAQRDVIETVLRQPRKIDLIECPLHHLLVIVLRTEALHAATMSENPLASCPRSGPSLLPWTATGRSPVSRRAFSVTTRNSLDDASSPRTSLPLRIAKGPKLAARPAVCCLLRSRGRIYKSRPLIYAPRKCDKAGHPPTSAGAKCAIRCARIGHRMTNWKRKPAERHGL